MDGTVIDRCAQATLSGCRRLGRLLGNPGVLVAMTKLSFLETLNKLGMKFDHFNQLTDSKRAGHRSLRTVAGH